MSSGISRTITLIALLAVWKVLKRAKSYSNASKRCNLCIREKLYLIICKPDMASLNQHNELVSTCRHALRKIYLKIL